MKTQPAGDPDDLIPPNERDWIGERGKIRYPKTTPDSTGLYLWLNRYVRNKGHMEEDEKIL